MCRRAEEIGFGRLYNIENMEATVAAKGFGIFSLSNEELLNELSFQAVRSQIKQMK